MNTAEDLLHTVDQLQTVEVIGSVTEIRGLTILVRDLPLPIGSTVMIKAMRHEVVGEVVGFDDEMTLVMLMGDTTGIRRGDRVVSLQGGEMASVGHGMLGRIVNGLGEPIDGKGPIRSSVNRPIRPRPLDPMKRVRIDTPLGTGVRAIDGMLTAGRGQRLGIFAGPGVGKSTLMGMIARNTDADVSVISLVGERGRELKDFLENSLGEEGLKRSVVIISTGDDPALLRVRAALYATTVAEYFRDAGNDVVFMMDSVTRFAQAQRQIGLAAGEPPTTKGYTPTVFSMLPTLMERAGRTERGSITGFYTILVEGDDLTEPISDAAMGILDGHLVLSRKLATKSHWPAISVTESVSRVANDVIDNNQKQSRDQILRMMANYTEVEDLVNIGAYAAGSNPDYDLAISMYPDIRQYLQQATEESVSFADARTGLVRLALESGQRIAQIQQPQQAAQPGPQL